MRIGELMRNAAVGDYQAALQGMVCPRMLRAWRNRTNRTRGIWSEAVYDIIKWPHRNVQIVVPTACLYVACGWYVEKNGGDAFYGSHPDLENWKLIRELALDLILAPPEKTMMSCTWAAWQRSQTILKKARGRAG